MLLCIVCYIGSSSYKSDKYLYYTYIYFIISFIFHLLFIYLFIIKNISLQASFNSNNNIFITDTQSIIGFYCILLPSEISRYDKLVSQYGTDNDS